MTKESFTYLVPREEGCITYLPVGLAGGVNGPFTIIVLEVVPGHLNINLRKQLLPPPTKQERCDRCVGTVIRTVEIDLTMGGHSRTHGIGNIRSRNSIIRRQTTQPAKWI